MKIEDREWRRSRNETVGMIAAYTHVMIIIKILHAVAMTIIDFMCVRKSVRYISARVWDNHAENYRQQKSIMLAMHDGDMNGAEILYACAYDLYCPCLLLIHVSSRVHSHSLMFHTL